MTMAAFQDAAPAWAAAGIVPLPIARDGKRPLVNHPEKFGRQAALQIARKFPDANLGFWCGQHNRLTVVDIDSDADAELQHAINTYGDSPVIAETPSGGRHAYYRHGGERRHIRPDKAHAIDMLGGGLCIAPPSIKPSGGVYRFVRGGLADFHSLRTIRQGALRPSVAPAVQESTFMDADKAAIGARNDALFGSRSPWLTMPSHRRDYWSGRGQRMQNYQSHRCPMPKCARRPAAHGVTRWRTA